MEAKVPQRPRTLVFRNLTEAYEAQILEGPFCDIRFGSALYDDLKNAVPYGETVPFVFQTPLSGSDELVTFATADADATFFGDFVGILNKHGNYHYAVRVGGLLGVYRETVAASAGKSDPDGKASVVYFKNIVPVNVTVPV